MLLDLILQVYLVATGILLLLYMPRWRCWFYGRVKQPRLTARENRRIAVLIPARKESAAIAPLFDCLGRQTYPRDRFDVYVVVDRADDPTVKMAEYAGFLPHVAKHQHCKGDALDSVLKRILTEYRNRYDAYLIIDADCMLADDYLTEMNNALESGADILLSRKKLKNYFFGGRDKQPLSACCNGLIWTLMDAMGNNAKTRHGDPCFVVGTGVMLTDRVVRQNGGWPYRSTVTEDVELMHDAVRQGWRTFYYQHAVLYMEEALSHRVTNKRRCRWMTGVVDSKRIYAAMPTPENVRSRHLYHSRCMTIVYLLIGLSTLFAVGNALAAAVFSTFRLPFWLPALRNAVIGVGAIYAMFFVMTLFAIIADYENIKLPFWRKLILLFVHPFFYMEYIPIVAVALFTGYGRRWDAIERADFAESEIKL